MSTDKSREKEGISGPGEDSARAIIKSTSLLSVGTLSSRILGFLRDIILARMFGTGVRAEAFFVALRIPNLLRDFVGEGATNSAVVPVFSEYLHTKGQESFWKFFNVILVLFLIVLSAITLAGMLLAPVIVRIIAPGFMADPKTLALTVRLTQIMFPYLVFIGLTAYSMGILFTFRSFLAPAFSPCLLNIAIIFSALISSKTMQEPVFGLAIGVLIGGILQLAAHVYPLHRSGMRLKRPETLRHPGAAQIGKLLVPRMIGSGVYELNVLIDTFCASLAMIVGQGGISAIYYSNRIIQLPMGVFGISLASAVLPSLSALASKKDFASVKRTILFALENIFLVMMPVTVMLLIFARPVIRVLFERGEFTAYSTDITSLALVFYALGLFSFGGIKILVTAFHALQDTKTPVKIAAACLGLNAVLNFILMVPLKIGGVALASSIAGTVNFAALFVMMSKRLGSFPSGLVKYAGKVIAAALLTGIFSEALWAARGFSVGISTLGLVGISALAFYVAVCWILRIEQAREIMRRVCPVLHRP